MRTLLLILLLPLTLPAQTIDRWDVVRNGYYKVVVDGDTLQDNFTRYDTALKFAYDNATGGEIQIVPPSYDFNYSLTEPDTTESVVYDTVGVQSLTLRQVNMGYQRIDGERALTYDAEAHGDSVLFEYFYNGQRLQKSLQYPKGGIVRDTLKDPPIDSIQVWVHGYWDKWVEPYREIVDIAFLDTLGEDPDTEPNTMALQDIPYVTASWTSPATDLTGYVGYFDLSDAPQSWWDEVNSSDGTKLRVAKDDASEGSTSATELAFDVQGFDDTAQEGRLWFRWSGTLSTTPDDIRIYPAKLSATSYSATDTFGSQAVWVDYQAVFHGEGTADATGSGNTLSVGEGSPTIEASKIGNGFSFDGDDAYEAADDASLDLTGDGTWQCFYRAGSTPSSNHYTMFIKGLNWGLSHRTTNKMMAFTHSGAYDVVSSSSSLSTNTWYMVHGVYDSGTLRVYLDGTEDGSTSASTPTTSGRRAAIGGNDDFGENVVGDVDELRFARQALSADRISYEYANQYDPGTFWSSITLDNAGQTLTLSGSIDTSVTTAGILSKQSSLSGLSESSMTNSASLSQVSILSGTISPAFSLSGSVLYIESLTGQIASSLSVNGNVSELSTLAGMSNNMLTVNGSLSEQATLAGESSSESVLSASTSETAFLSGSVGSIFSATGNAVKESSVSGSLDSQSELSGNISKKALLSGNAGSEFDLSGNVTMQAILSGDIPTESILSGNVIILEEGIVNLSGAINTESTLSGNISTLKSIQGIIESETELSGNLIKEVSLSGNTLTISSLSADPSIQKALHGTLSGGLTPAGGSWEGTIDITNSPLYSISFDIQPLHEIAINERPMQKITVTEQPFYSVTITDTPLYNIKITDE